MKKNNNSSENKSSYELYSIFLKECNRWVWKKNIEKWLVQCYLIWLNRLCDWYTFSGEWDLIAWVESSEFEGETAESWGDCESCVRRAQHAQEGTANSKEWKGYTAVSAQSQNGWCLRDSFERAKQTRRRNEETFCLC